MKITNEQLDNLLQMLSLTKEEEASCGDCLQKMAEFAETILAGKTVPDGLKSIDEHLELCGECREEFEALKVSLSDDKNQV